MKKQAILSLLVFVVAVCGCSSDYLSDQRRQAIKCAENWKTQGFNFDPNSTTCSQMRQRVQTIRRAEYWRNKGYVLDPNSLTKEEMDIKVKDIDRARYWKKRGYEFDPYKITRYEMNRQAKELDKIKYWKKAGYYYDPNSQTVFLTARKKTKLSSLASLHNGGSGYRTFGSSYRSLSLPKSYSYQRYDPRLPIAENDSYYGQISEATGRPKTVHVRGYYRKDGTLGEKTERGIYLWQWSANKFNADSISNPFGAGNRFNPNSINNEFGKYGSKFSPYSTRNSFTTEAPKLYDSQGNYRGRLSNNVFDPDSISNPFGRYGNRFSPESINNPFTPDSPSNPFGHGLSIFGEK